MSTSTRAMLITLLVSSAAVAQNNRSAVSVNGSDANPCTTTAPCRSFTAALAHTNPGGQAVAFDSGGYGAFAITHAVNRVGAPGGHVPNPDTSGNGIEANSGVADSVPI